MRNCKINFIGSYNLKNNLLNIHFILNFKKTFIWAFKILMLANLALKKSNSKNKTLHAKKSLFISALPHNINNMTP